MTEKEEDVNLAELANDIAMAPITLAKNIGKELKGTPKEKKIQKHKQIINRMDTMLIEVKLFRKGYEKKQIDEILEVIKECQEEKQNAKSSQE